jgi:hypothetical protein
VKRDDNRGIWAPEWDCWLGRRGGCRWSWGGWRVEWDGRGGERVGGELLCSGGRRRIGLLAVRRVLVWWDREEWRKADLVEAVLELG